MNRRPILAQGRKRAYAGEYWVVRYDKSRKGEVVHLTKQEISGYVSIKFMNTGICFIPEKLITLIRRINVSLPKKKGNSRGKK